LTRIDGTAAVLNAMNAGGTADIPVKTSEARISGPSPSTVNYVGLTAPAGQASSPTFVLPGADGATGQFLQTDGSFNLAFATAMAYAEMVNETAFTNTDTTLALFTPAANALITKCQIEVSTTTAAGSPTISIGVAGTVARDMATTESDLKTVGLYEVYSNTVTTTSLAMIATVVASAQTFTGFVRVWYVNPQ
jgi:hypothetical protein